MVFSYPRTLGALTGWMMVGFVIGVAAHSAILYPLLTVGQWWGILVLLVTLLLYASGFKRDSYFRGNDKMREISISVVLLGMVFAFSLGFARCDLFAFPRLQRSQGHAFLQKSTGSPNILERWRSRLTARIALALPRDEAALVTGILYGDQQLSKEQRDLFRSAGLMHIVAVSGSNVTIVVQVLALLVVRIGLKRRHTFILTSIALFLFCGFVGFSASVMRAAFMGWLAIVAREVGRVPQSSRLLLVTAVILLSMNPWQLFYDAGFALSFLAMWGLLAWTPLIQEGLMWLPNWLELRTTLSMTLGATLMTAPYLAWSFGQLSLAGIITNIFALPLVSCVMLWGAITAVWGNGFGGSVVNAPAFGFARLIEFVASITHHLPWLERKTTGMSIVSVTVFYVVMFYFWRVLRTRKDFSTGEGVIFEKEGICR